MFESVLIRRKKSKDIPCRVRVVIGEETLYTKVSHDRQDKRASWRDDYLTFHLIKGITRDGKISILDDDE